MLINRTFSNEIHKFFNCGVDVSHGQIYEILLFIYNMHSVYIYKHVFYKTFYKIFYSVYDQYIWRSVYFIRV